MEALRELLAGAGFEQVQTLLQSGNVVFRTSERDTARIETRLEREAERKLGLATQFFVRTAAEWETIVARTPFPREAAEIPGYVHVMALKSAPSTKQWEALSGAIRGRERVRGDGRVAYLVYPDGVGRSKLTTALIEKNLGTRGTMRNWNTVSKLAGMLAAME
jgi:uncharacterized protein (DUF1697 family)